jgi:plasmid rolling circle replication initiator protein Rep
VLSYGGLLKQKHKILNLDDAEDGNLINTSDEDYKPFSKSLTIF